MVKRMLGGTILSSAIAIAVVAGAHANEYSNSDSKAHLAKTFGVGAGLGSPLVAAKLEGSGLIIDGGTVLRHDGGTDMISVSRVAIPEGGLGISTETGLGKVARNLGTINRARSPAPQRPDFNTLRRTYM